jgi:hypothetical protein
MRGRGFHFDAHVGGVDFDFRSLVQVKRGAGRKEGFVELAFLQASLEKLVDGVDLVGYVAQGASSHGTPAPKTFATLSAKLVKQLAGYHQRTSLD